MAMEIVAVFKTELELVNVSGEVYTLPTKTLLGYAVFEGSKIISKVFPSYEKALEWMNKERSRRLGNPER